MTPPTIPKTSDESLETISTEMRPIQMNAPRPTPQSAETTP